VKSRDSEYLENESRKYLDKDQQISSAITFSQSLFKIEVKVDIKPYQLGEIDVVKLNHWLQ
jgi:hypothetical protein